MWLDLSKIIEVPGASIPFETALDPERLLTASVTAFRAPPEASGRVTNTAGVLTLTAPEGAETTLTLYDDGSLSYILSLEEMMDLTLFLDKAE